MVAARIHPQSRSAPSDRLEAAILFGDLETSGGRAAFACLGTEPMRQSSTCRTLIKELQNDPRNAVHDCAFKDCSPLPDITNRDKLAELLKGPGAGSLEPLVLNSRLVGCSAILAGMPGRGRSQRNKLQGGIGELLEKFNQNGCGEVDQSGDQHRAQ